MGLLKIGVNINFEVRPDDGCDRRDTVNVGSTSPAPRKRDAWAIARTAAVVAGLGFVIASLAAACLDHYDEEWGCPTTADGGTDCDGGASVIDAPTGSGSGSGAI